MLLQRFFYLSFCVFWFCLPGFTLPEHNLKQKFNSTNEFQSFVDVTVLGAYGDLAKKYLWKGFFDLFVKQEQYGNDTALFRFFGAARKPFSEGNTLLKKALHGISFCKTEDDDCNSSKIVFLSKIKYVQLKSEADYRSHCQENLSGYEDACHNDNYNDSRCDHVERVFYLSVPPFTYKGIAKNINHVCRAGGVDLKVVVEKPFGHDYRSAVELIDSLSTYFKEEEIYRVDHYLGKPAVQAIDSTRSLNPLLDDLLNKDHVKKIEVMMKEKDGLEGRSEFYDKYGVVSDVIQNHLSEIIYKLTKESLTNNGVVHEYEKEKISLQRKIMTLEKKKAIIYGQYTGYQLQVKKEGGRKNSTTPTCASALLKIASARWKGVPIVVTAGKMLDERVGYARVIFKSRGDDDEPQLIFYIGHGSLNTPAIIISKSLIDDVIVHKGVWRKRVGKEAHVIGQQSHVLGVALDRCHVFTATAARDAYSFLIERIWSGERDSNFVSAPSLMESWRVWDDVLTPSEPPRLYDAGEKPSSLDTDEWNSDDDDEAARLAHDIIEQINNLHPRRFNIAFSGGTSPISLFDHLVAASLPWQRVDVWQVDERCDSSHSNMAMIKRHLVDRIASPPDIHHMLPHYDDDVDDACSPEALQRYEQAVASMGRFDYVVLGMGADGHIASLFPHHQALTENEKFVVIADGIEGVVSPKRMTLTYKSIMSSRHVALLVRGGDEKKRAMLKMARSSSSCDQTAHPVCALVSSLPDLKWFVSDHPTLSPHDEL